MVRWSHDEGEKKREGTLRRPPNQTGKTTGMEFGREMTMETTGSTNKREPSRTGKSDVEESCDVILSKD